MRNGKHKKSDKVIDLTYLNKKAQEDPYVHNLEKVIDEYDAHLLSTYSLGMGLALGVFGNFIVSYFFWFMWDQKNFTVSEMYSMGIIVIVGFVLLQAMLFLKIRKLKKGRRGVAKEMLKKWQEAIRKVHKEETGLDVSFPDEETIIVDFPKKIQKN